MAFFTEIDKKNPKLLMKPKRPQLAKAIPTNKSKAGSIPLPNLKIYYEAIVIKTVWYWRKKDK